MNRKHILWVALLGIALITGCTEQETAVKDVQSKQQNEELNDRMKRPDVLYYEEVVLTSDACVVIMQIQENLWYICLRGRYWHSYPKLKPKEKYDETYLRDVLDNIVIDIGKADKIKEIVPILGSGHPDEIGVSTTIGYWIFTEKKTEVAKVFKGSDRFNFK